MKEVFSTIKEIAVTSHFLVKEIWFEDVLKIIPSKASYERRRLDTQEVYNMWSYSLNKKQYNDYNVILKSIKIKEKQNVISNESEYLIITKTFNDNKKECIQIVGDCVSNGLQNFAFELRNSVPKGLKISPLLNVVSFTKSKLNKNALNNIDMKDLNAFMFAEAGAMGEAGEILIIRNNEILKTNIFDEDNDVSYDDVINLFEGIEINRIYSDVDFYSIIINSERWFYFNLGMGNHLYLSDSFYRKIGNELFDVKLNKRYSNWINFICDNSKL